MSDTSSTYDLYVLESAQEPCALLCFHGGSDVLTRLLTVLDKAGKVVTSNGPTPCTARRDCFCLDVVVFGEFSEADMTALITGLGFEPPNTAATN
jgi:hypothetical protein